MIEKHLIESYIVTLAKHGCGVGGASPFVVKQWASKIIDGTMTEQERYALKAQHAAIVGKMDEILRHESVLSQVARKEWVPLVGTGLAINPHHLAEEKALRNHGQSIATLARRGGLLPREAVAIIQDKDWWRTSDHSFTEAMEILAKSTAVNPASDERIVKADRYGVPIDAVLKSAFDWKMDWHMASHLFLCDGAKIILTRRAMTKSFFPGCWTFAVSGTRKSGEDAYECIVRESKEELGVDPEIKRSVCAKYQTQVFNSFNCHDDIFVGFHHGDVHPDTRETDEVLEIVGLDKLHDMLESGYLSPAVPMLLKTVKLLLKDAVDSSPA